MTQVQQQIVEALAKLGQQINPTFNSDRFIRDCEWKLAQTKRGTR